MTEKEIAAAAVAKEAADKAVAEAAGNVDFKAELEKEKARIAKAEHTIVDLKNKLKDKEGNDVDIVALEESLREKLAKEQEAKFEQFKVEQAKSSIDTEIAKLTSNPDEQALIKFNYENRIVRSGFDPKSIADDISNAYVLSNKPRMEKTIEELRQKALSNMTRKTGDAAPSDPTPNAKVLTPEMETFVKKLALKQGVTEDEVRAKLIKNGAL